jgi:hypothetical protein
MPAKKPPTNTVKATGWSLDPKRIGPGRFIPKFIEEPAAIEAYLQGDEEPLCALITDRNRTGQSLSTKTVDFLSRILRNEKLRGKGRPPGSGYKHDWGTRLIFAQNVERMVKGGMSKAQAWERIGRMCQRSERTIRRYHEEFFPPTR